MPTLEEIRSAPKVLLHDHLDGGLRPQTVLELAREIGYADLPGAGVEELTRKLTEGAHRGHLEVYLDAFRHTVAVMQTADALRRGPGRRRGRLRRSPLRPRAAHPARTEPGRGGRGGPRGFP